MSASGEKTFKKGDFLFHEGDISRSMYLIKKGRVAILKPKGTAFIQLAEVRQNEMIGELAFFDPERKPRSASAMALSTVEVVEIGYDALQKHYETLPDFMRKIFGSVVDRIRKANDTIRKLQKDVIQIEGFSRSAETAEGHELSQEAGLRAVLDSAAADIDLCFGRKAPDAAGIEIQLTPDQAKAAHRDKDQSDS
jgi:CRP/FNR family cyclic AMP-dependent transcriptional regulator